MKNSNLNTLIFYSIADKKLFFFKQIDYNEVYYNILLDILMYCQYKISSTTYNTSVLALVKKVKVSLLKILLNKENKRFFSR